jgi:uncharacterized protein DUF5681
MESFEDDGWSEEGDDHEVGYRKPPKHSRFKKGHSGNPRGKPRGTKNSATLLRQALLASVLIKQNGRQTKTTKLQVIVRRLVHQAMKGDYTSIRILFRYAGLDRLINEPEHQPQGLSAEVAQAIRREIAGDLYEPETQEASVSEPEAVPAFANVEKETRSGKGIPGQPYEVGYRKPPRHTRFQKGRSGNPFGRPRAPRSFRMLTLRLLDEEVSLNENGQQRVLSRLQIIFMQMVNKATMGDQKFQALLLEYAPAVDLKFRRRLTPELVQRAMLLVRGSLESVDV